MRKEEIVPLFDCIWCLDFERESEYVEEAHEEERNDRIYISNLLRSCSMNCEITNKTKINKTLC